MRGNSRSRAQAGDGTAPSASSSKPSTSTKRQPGPTPRRVSTCTGHSERGAQPRHHPTLPSPPRGSPPRPGDTAQRAAPSAGGTLCRPRPLAAAATTARGGALGEGAASAPLRRCGRAPRSGSVPLCSAPLGRRCSSRAG